MNEYDPLRYGVKIQRPVKRGITSPGDQNRLVLEILNPAHRIEHRVVFECLDPFSGGRFGVNEPPPAAMTTILVSNLVPISVVR